MNKQYGKYTNAYISIKPQDKSTSTWLSPNILSSNIFFVLCSNRAKSMMSSPGRQCCGSNKNRTKLETTLVITMLSSRKLCRLGKRIKKVGDKDWLWLYLRFSRSDFHRSLLFVTVTPTTKNWRAKSTVKIHSNYAATFNTSTWHHRVILKAFFASTCIIIATW